MTIGIADSFDDNIFNNLRDNSKIYVSISELVTCTERSIVNKVLLATSKQ